MAGSRSAGTSGIGRNKSFEVGTESSNNNERERQTDRQTDRQTERQTETDTER